MSQISFKLQYVVGIKEKRNLISEIFFVCLKLLFLELHLYF